MKALNIALGVLQAFVGVTAIVSGALLVAAPSGALLQAPPEMLQATPFRDFLIPGIILVLVNGFGQGAAAMLTFRRHPRAPPAGAVFGLGLMIWIFVQVNMIGGGHWLQYSYFAIGVAETSLSWLIRPIPENVELH